MSDEPEGEKAKQERGYRWWLRYIYVPILSPIMVAVIAAYAAIEVAKIASAASGDLHEATPTAAVSPAVTPVPSIETNTPPTATSAPTLDTATSTASPTPTPLTETNPAPSLPVIGQHVVRRGETLYCIGRAYRVQPNAIAQASGLASSARLIAGQILNIPDVPWVDIPDGPRCAPQIGEADTPAPPNPTTPPPDSPGPTLTDTPPVTPTVGLPDLAGVTLQTVGLATINAFGDIEVPIRVVATNRGGSAAGIFKVAIEYSGPEGAFAAPFTVPGQNSIWYPFTSAPLATGNAVTFPGTVTLRSTLQGQGISLWATIDSCHGDEFMPAYCRVEESDDLNNVSATMVMLLPSNRPPIVAITSPVDGADYGYEGYDDKLGLPYTTVILEGSAVDPEDGALGGSASVWTTDRTDIHPSAVLGTGTHVTATLYSNVCAGVWHALTLTATDRDGNVVTAATRVLVWEIC